MNTASGPKSSLPVVSSGACCGGWPVGRLLLTLALVAGYYAVRGSVTAWLNGFYSPSGADATTVPVLLVLGVLGLVVWLWRAVLLTDQRFQAPLLVTTILVTGDAAFGILLSHHNETLAWLTNGVITSYTPTFVAIATTVGAELLLGRFFWGKWPHPASAYVSGISAGILVKSPYLWPFLLAAFLSIGSKYVLRAGPKRWALVAQLAMVALLGLVILKTRDKGPTLLETLTPEGVWASAQAALELRPETVGLLAALGGLALLSAAGPSDRHVWNPTNFGITVLLFLAPEYVASLSVEAGNTPWALMVIWALGGMILYRLRRLHISAAFVLAFVPLAFLRAAFTGDPWQTELAPLASPMFQLYICFMITDPKTSVRGWWPQIVVAVLVAVVETVLRLALEDMHSFYHALFFVGPVANLVENLVRPAAPVAQAGAGAAAGAIRAGAPARVAVAAG